MAGNVTQLQPSAPGVDLAQADVARAEVTREQAAQIILQAGGGAGSQGINADVGGMMALLATLIKITKRNSARYMPFGFGLAAWARQQVLTENPLRSYLLVQNVGSGDLMVVMETGPIAVQDLSSAANQQQLTNQQLRAVRVVAGGYFEPLTPPVNPVTIFTLGTGTTGLVVEGT